MTSVDGWTLDLVEDIDLPGWIFLPEGLSPREQEQWLAEATTLLWGIIGPSLRADDEMNEAMVRSVFRQGLDARFASGSYAMYQVWPRAVPAAVMCHVNVVASQDLPDWRTLDGVLHLADARYLGSGLQYSTRRRVEGVDNVDLVSANFIFDDGDVALMLTLEESLPPLITPALVGLTILKDALKLTRADGSAFTAVAPAAVVKDESWSEFGTQGAL